jgi:hypothetical protein
MGIEEERADIPPVPTDEDVSERESEHNIITDLIPHLTDGSLVEAWAALPFVDRLRVRLLMAQLAQTFEHLEPTFQQVYGPGWIRTMLADVESYGVRLPAPSTLDELVRDTNMLAWPEDAPPGTPTAAAAHEQEIAREANEQAVARIMERGGPNPARQ